MAKSSEVKIHKSAVNGRIVSSAYASKHKSTTYATTVTRKSGK